MSEILRQFEKMRVVPVVAIQKAEDAMQLADALIEGGCPAQKSPSGQRQPWMPCALWPDGKIFWWGPARF